MCEQRRTGLGVMLRVSAQVSLLDWYNVKHGSHQSPGCESSTVPGKILLLQIS